MGAVEETDSRRTEHKLRNEHIVVSIGFRWSRVIYVFSEIKYKAWFRETCAVHGKQTSTSSNNYSLVFRIIQLLLATHPYYDPLDCISHFLC